jgi:hypothetical protein
LKNIEAAGSGALDQLLASVVRKLEELGVPVGMLSAFIQGSGEKSPARNDPGSLMSPITCKK